MSASGEKVSLSTKIYYGFGSVAFGVKDNGFAYFLLLFYNQVVGLSPSLTAMALFIALCFDAISDPVIGHWSDNMRSKWGRRHPFMYASIIPIGITYFLIWNPPAGMDDTSAFWYLILLAILVRTFVTLYEIPSTSLVAELTDDYDERTSMLGFRFMFGWWGGLTMAVLAWGVFLADGLTAKGFGTYGIFGAIIIIIAIFISAVGTHRHIPDLHSPPPGHSKKLIDNLLELRETLTNRNFLALFISAIFSALAIGLHSNLINYFFLYFWDLETVEIRNLNFVYYFSAVAALLLAQWASQRRDKKQVAIVIWTAAIVVQPLPVLLRVVNLMPSNDSGLILPLLMAHGFIEVTLSVAAAIIISSMVADIVEDSEKKTGRRSEATFFAARGFAAKVVNGSGVISAGLILSVTGFPDNAVAGAVPQITLNKLALFYAPSLLVCYLAALYGMSFYKISRDAHRENVAAASATRNSHNAEGPGGNTVVSPDKSPAE